MKLKNIFNSQSKIIQKRIDYWSAYKDGYDKYLTELGLKCARVGMWDIYFEHERRRTLVANLIRKLKNLKKKQNETNTNMCLCRRSTARRI